MTTKPSDLIAIANPKLAERLAEKSKPKNKTTQTTATNNNSDTDQAPAHQTFKQEIWRAVFTLNIFRYIFGLVLFGVGFAVTSRSDINIVRTLVHPNWITYCASALLCSASVFTLFTKLRRFPLGQILIIQFAIDLVITGLLVHATGSITSSFSLTFLVIVTTGSVVLRRKNALALASGATIIIFYEHFYSVLKSGATIDWSFDALGMYSVLLMFSGVAISYLARLVRQAELKSFVPGNESIEDYLVREEINALKSALNATEGNKTEAAKLLGMTFRSFRYKLSKYEIS